LSRVQCISKIRGPRILFGLFAGWFCLQSSSPAQTPPLQEVGCGFGRIVWSSPRPGSQLPPTPELLAIVIQSLESIKGHVTTKNLSLIHYEDQFMGNGLALLERETNIIASRTVRDLQSTITNLATSVLALHLAADAQNEFGAIHKLAEVQAGVERLKTFFSAADLRAADLLSKRYGCLTHQNQLGTKGELCQECRLPYSVAIRIRAKDDTLRPGPQAVGALSSTDRPLTPGEQANARLRLVRFDGAPLTASNLIRIHGERIHLFLIDRTLTDYHHVHPQPLPDAGEYTFQFTPSQRGKYRAWAEVHVMPYGVEQYAVTDIGEADSNKVVEQRELRTRVEEDGLRYELEVVSTPLKFSTPSQLKLRVTKSDGTPFTDLEPFMEAYAHLAGFGEGLRSVIHLHPQTPPVRDPQARGGPELDFHIVPSTPGYVRLFAQVKINGELKTIPFGLNVRP
jgi:hypothetical protein